jgi:hypothetical protein
VIRRGIGQIRLTPAGKILGFDIAALISIASALAYDTRALLMLFHFAETGIQEAINHDSEHPEHHDPHHGAGGG